jgi:hypothetical protein
MLFSNTEIPELNFTFNGRTIPITNSHKHLGVTFSSDAKWKALFRQPITPTAHYSDNPLLRQPITPTAHFSDNAK